MKRRTSPPLILFVALLLTLAPCATLAEPGSAAIAAFNSYASAVEARLNLKHASQATFLDLSPQTVEQVLRGEPVVEQLTSRGEVPAALLHHWRGTAFAPGATAAQFERLLRDFGGYPKTFAPEVLRAKVLGQDGDRLRASMRVRQRHVLTVVMDATYDIDFWRLDARHGYSASRSTRISEIADAGTPGEHALSAKDEHGFLWRQNTYWSWEERDEGLYLEVESLSLSRSIPTGLGWAVRPFVESVPRESLEFTLRSACAALRNGKSDQGQQARMERTR